jgi:hypothetical protein
MLVFLVLRQVMPIASALAGGASLNTFSAMGRTIQLAFAATRRQSRDVLAHSHRYVGETARKR